MLSLNYFLFSVEINANSINRSPNFLYLLFNCFFHSGRRFNVFSSLHTNLLFNQVHRLVLWRVTVSIVKLHFRTLCLRILANKSILERSYFFINDTVWFLKRKINVNVGEMFYSNFIFILLSVICNRYSSLYDLCLITTPTYDQSNFDLHFWESQIIPSCSSNGNDTVTIFYGNHTAFQIALKMVNTRGTFMQVLLK